MTITNIIFDHTQGKVSEAIQGMAFEELMDECNRNYELIVEEYKANGRKGGSTSETIELVLKSLPDSLTKEETAVLSAFIMMCITAKTERAKQRDPLDFLMRMLRDDMRKFGEDLE